MSKNEIKFHKEYERWGEFSNYFSAKIKAAIPSNLTPNGEPAADSVWLTPELDWSTSEHLFQAMKFSESGKEHLATDVSKIPTADGARNFPKGKTARRDWHSGHVPYKIRAMRYTVRKKFSQNDRLKNVLLSTNDDILIENTQAAGSYDDPFWGNGHSGTGQNWLGKILEEIRTELKVSGGTPPTPPSTPPPSTPFSSTNPSGVKLNNTEIHVFEAKIETELSNKGIVTSDLSPQYQGWRNYIITNEWKAGELDNYEKELKREIERVANKKKQPNSPPKTTPNPSPNATQNYRDRWVQELEKQFQELDFGDNHDTIVKELSATKDRIKGTEFEIEVKIDIFAKQFLGVLKKFGKKKSGTNPINDPNSPSPSTPEEKESFLNELKDLKEKSAKDFEEEDNKPVEINDIKKYFEENEINSIALKDNGELTIVFQDKTTKTTLANDEQLQLVKKYFRQENKKSLNREMLNISQNSNHPPVKPNYLPRILVVGGLVILVLFSALVFSRQKRIQQRKKTRSKSN